MSAITAEELISLERKGWDALCASRGGAFYGEIMTADSVMILVNGAVLDRDAVVASLDAAPPWASYSIVHERFVSLGSDAAALTYRARAHRPGEEAFTALMTSVYRVVDGQLRLALYQQTAAHDAATADDTAAAG